MPSTPTTPVAIPIEAYFRRRFAITFQLLDYWELPWSTQRLKFAAFGLLRAYRAGLPPIMEDDNDKLDSQLPL